MAAGDRIFMAKESTSQEILAKTNQIIEAGKEKPKRYGMRINRLDSNPATRVKYVLDAVGMTPAGMNYSGGGFDYGDWGDICPVRWQPWQRVEVRFVVLECEQPCDEREHEHRGEPILSMTERITKSTPFPYTAGR